MVLPMVCFWGGILCIKANGDGGVFRQFKKNVCVCLYIWNIEEMFLEQQISILEWFLKDRVTLKTGVVI